MSKATESRGAAPSQGLPTGRSTISRWASLATLVAGLFSTRFADAQVDRLAATRDRDGRLWLMLTIEDVTAVDGPFAVFGWKQSLPGGALVDAGIPGAGVRASLGNSPI